MAVESDGKKYVLVLLKKKENGFSLKTIEVQLGEIGHGNNEILTSAKLSAAGQKIGKRWISFHVISPFNYRNKQTKRHFWDLLEDQSKSIFYDL